MKILIDIDPNLYTRRNGDVVEDYWVDHVRRRYAFKKLR